VPVPVSDLRARFPAYRRTLDGRPVVYLDGPGGTQVPDSVIEAIGSYLRDGGSNVGGGFATSLVSDRVVAEARSAMADLLGGRPEEVVFGPNMTTLTFGMSRALSRAWQPGDRIVVTGLDHDANISPWVAAATDRGAEVVFAELDRRVPTVDLDHLESLLDRRVRLVAVTHASNAFGTVVDVARVCRAAHSVGALVYVDGVHHTPHRPVDVGELGCDFYVCSGYKFFGPHVGVLWGRAELLAEITPYRVRPAPPDPPGSFETGTLAFEGLAGLTAAVDYLAGIAPDGGVDRRIDLVASMTAVASYEQELGHRFLSGLDRLSGVRLYGLPDPDGDRTPTFAIELEGWEPRAVAAELGRRGLFVWAGHYYAVEPMRRLGVLDRGGLVRIGFVHTTTVDEVDRLLEVLDALTSS